MLDLIDSHTICSSCCLFSTSCLSPFYRAFDKSLKSRNEQWGVRDLEEVTKAAELQDLELVEKIEMPANNLSLIFRRRSNIL